MAERALLLVREKRKGLRAELARLFVQSACDDTPGVAVVRHVEVAVAVEVALEQLFVDVVQHRNLRLLADLAAELVAERTERRGLAHVEETNLGYAGHAVEDELSGHLVPVFRLLENVEVGIASDHARRDPATLRGQPGWFELLRHLLLAPDERRDDAEGADHRERSGRE